jgi:pSer/pThr/pTyr-binding forkhead associated (FHA) protein
MIQLKIISGSTADAIQVVRRFPFRIGRAPDNDLRLEAPGVWDNHLTLEFQKPEGFVLRAAPDAFGSAKIQFWLAAPLQRGLRLRELSVWALLVAVTAFQFVLIYRLLK